MISTIFFQKRVFFFFFCKKSLIAFWFQKDTYALLYSWFLHSFERAPGNTLRKDSVLLMSRDIHHPCNLQKKSEFIK